jgi:hypothetical protein
MTILASILAVILAAAAVLGLLWLVIRVVRHAWKGTTRDIYTAEAALQQVQRALADLRKNYPGVADNFSNGLASGVFDSLGLNEALNLALHKLDSGDLQGAKEEVSRIQEWYEGVEDMIRREREQART